APDQGNTDGALAQIRDPSRQPVVGEPFALQSSQRLVLSLRPVVERVVVGHVEGGQAGVLEHERPGGGGAKRKAARGRARPGKAPRASRCRERPFEVGDGEIGSTEETADRRERGLAGVTGERHVAAGDEREAGTQVARWYRERAQRRHGGCRGCDGRRRRRYTRDEEGERHSREN